jgi:hypothetical protein
VLRDGLSNDKNPFEFPFELIQILNKAKFSKVEIFEMATRPVEQIVNFEKEK